MILHQKHTTILIKIIAQKALRRKSHGEKSLQTHLKFKMKSTKISTSNLHQKSPTNLKPQHPQHLTPKSPTSPQPQARTSK